MGSTACGRCLPVGRCSHAHACITESCCHWREGRFPPTHLVASEGAAVRRLRAGDDGRVQIGALDGHPEEHAVRSRAARFHLPTLLLGQVAHRAQIGVSRAARRATDEMPHVVRTQFRHQFRVGNRAAEPNPQSRLVDTQNRQMLPDGFLARLALRVGFLDGLGLRVGFLDREKEASDARSACDWVPVRFRGVVGTCRRSSVRRRTGRPPMGAASFARRANYFALNTARSLNGKTYSSISLAR